MKATEGQVNYLKKKGFDASEWTKQKAHNKIQEIAEVEGWAEKNKKVESTEPEKTQDEAPKNEIRLTEGSIRSNALSSAVGYVDHLGTKATPEQIVKFARIFEVYIRNG